VADQAGVGLDRAEAPLLEVIAVTVTFPGARGADGESSVITAVREVSFDISVGETLALVGESGSGKSTTARAIMAVQPLSGGAVKFDGVDLASLKGRELRRIRRRFQIILQDPPASLDPRQTVLRTLREALFAARGSREVGADEIDSLLDLVGLSTEHAGKYPHELSGGQQQRVSIARAIAMQPDLVVCDEPVSALDVSVQAQIINLLGRLQGELGLSYLFIAHDLAVVRHVADRVAVMYLGSIVEIGPSDSVYGTPAHPYTAALLSAAPVPDAEVEATRERIVLEGEIPRPDQPPSGCHFHPRCPLWKELAQPDLCRSVAPVLAFVGENGTHRSACHFAADVTGGFDLHGETA